jgi:Dolichyl-phosphate-mannose-protein mannosyltransferase
LGECLLHTLLAGVTALSWLGLGSVLLAPLGHSPDRILDTLNRIGAGAVGFALLSFAAGWSGLLYPAAYLPVLGASAVAGLVATGSLVRGASPPQFRSWPRWQLLLLALLGVYVVLDILSTCAPITSPDALLYHAADPARFEKDHRISEVPWNSSSYEPFTVEMLVLDGFLLWDWVQGACAPLLLALASLCAVVGAAFRVADRATALLAGAIFFAQPFMSWEASSVFVEPGIAFAVALAAWNLLRFARHDELSALILAGAFSGAAAGMKYLGLIAALTLGVAAAILSRRRLRRARVLAFALPAVAVALPWYVKNAVLTGNPIYPYVFGGLNESAAAELQDTREMFGHGHSPLDLVLLPFRLLGNAEAFDAGEFISPLFLIFAPLAFLAARARRPAAVIWAGVMLYMIGWFFATQQARFLVPLMPVLAVLAAVGALALARRGEVGRWVAAGTVAAVLAMGVAVSSVYAAQFFPVVAGTESRRNFLHQKVSYYDGVEWLNRELRDDDMLVVDNWTLLYLDMPYITFGSMGDLLPPKAGAEETRSFVREYGITHAAVLAGHEDRRRQIGYLSARLLARIPVRAVTSRTLAELGPPDEMLIYAIEGST